MTYNKITYLVHGGPFDRDLYSQYLSLIVSNDPVLEAFDWSLERLMEVRDTVYKENVEFIDLYNIISIPAANKRTNDYKKQQAYLEIREKFEFGLFQQAAPLVMLSPLQVYAFHLESILLLEGSDLNYGKGFKLYKDLAHSDCVIYSSQDSSKKAEINELLHSAGINHVGLYFAEPAKREWGIQYNQWNRITTKYRIKGCFDARPFYNEFGEHIGLTMWR